MTSAIQKAIEESREREKREHRGTPSRFFFDSEIGAVIANVEAGEATLREARMALNEVVAPFLKERTRFREALAVAVGRLQGHGESSLYDEEAKWAKDVLEEIEAILKGET